MSGWYVKRDDKKYGPYSSTQLVEMAKKGQVLPIDWVAQGETAQWMPASQVKGLFAATSPATAAPPPLPVAAPAPGLATSEPMRMGKNLLGAIPASIFRPVIGMIVVIGLGLLVSFFCGSLILFLLSFIHIAAAATCLVLAVRLQKFLFAPLSALLTMTIWGWFCFSAVPIAVSIPGLLAGIAVGVWALFVFCSPAVKALFADSGNPGPLHRLELPVLAGIASGLLIVVLGIGGLRHMVSGDKSNTNSAGTGGTNQSGGGKAKGGFTPALMDKAVEGKGMLINELLAQVPPPIYSCRHKLNPAAQQHVWKVGDNQYILAIVGDNRVQGIQEGMKEVYFENLKKINAKYYDTYTP